MSQFLCALWYVMIPLEALLNWGSTCGRACGLACKVLQPHLRPCLVPCLRQDGPIMGGGLASGSSGLGWSFGCGLGSVPCNHGLALALDPYGFCCGHACRLACRFAFRLASGWMKFCLRLCLKSCLRSLGSDLASEFACGRAQALV